MRIADWKTAGFLNPRSEIRIPQSRDPRPLANARREWSERCTYEGPYRDEVLTSLIVLKAMTFETTGAVIAAPTTSLPEDIGGERNWDYRFCWLRDSVLTLEALLETGYTAEALAFRDYLLRVGTGDPKKVQIMYAIDGGLLQKTSFVVVGQDAGSKHDKALQLGVECLDEAAFLAKLGR